MLFDSIQFGHHAAENEYAESPELLSEGFYDCEGWTEEILTGKKFLILGYKGTGKSALIQRVIIDHKYDRFCSLNDLSNFPFSTFCSTLVSEYFGKENILPSSWEWLIVIQIIWLFEKDASLEKNESIKRFVSLLKMNGISQSDNIDNTWAQTLQKKSILHGPSLDISPVTGIESSVTAFKLEKEQIDIGDSTSFQQIVNYGKQIILAQKAENHYYIFFDGLDKAIFAGESAYESIAVLISQCSKLNQTFREKNIPVKLIVACRTDLFDKLPLINANSIRQTYAIPLEWHKDKRDFLKSNLCTMVNFRAKLSLNREVNVFTEFFPENLLIGKKNWLTYIFILFHTRCTPRDILCVLKSMQDAHDSSDEMLSITEIIKGLSDYSNDYFKNEIIDETNGYLSPSEIDQMFNILISLSAYRFDADVYFRRAEEVGVTTDRAIYILRILFDCGAVSNTFIAGDREQRPLSALYNSHAKLDTRKTILVHRGLWKALNYV